MESENGATYISVDIFPPWLSAARERNGSELFYIKQDAKQAGTVTLSGNNQRIDDISLHQTHLPRFHAGIFKEMHPTVTHGTSSLPGRGVTLQAKFILKTDFFPEILVLQTRSCSE